MGQKRRHFRDEFKTEAIARWRAAVGGWFRLPASWGSRPRCCATGAIAREGSMRGRGCPRNRRRPCLALRIGRQRSPGLAAKISARAWSATFQERLSRSSRKRRGEVPPRRRSAGCLAGAGHVRCTRRIAPGLLPGDHGQKARARSPSRTADDVRRVHAEHRGRSGGRVSTPNCVPRARASAASGSRG